MLKPISTQIRKTFSLENSTIVLEDFYKFNGESSIYCVENNKIIWYAEIKLESDVYTNVYIKEGKLYGSTWKGFTNNINKSTGKIISSKFTK